MKGGVCVAVSLAVPLGHLLALTVKPSDQGGREQVAALAEQVQQVAREAVELAYVDQGYTGPTPPKPRRQHPRGVRKIEAVAAKRDFAQICIEGTDRQHGLNL